MMIESNWRESLLLNVINDHEAAVYQLLKMDGSIYSLLIIMSIMIITNVALFLALAARNDQLGANVLVFINSINKVNF